MRVVGPMLFVVCATALAPPLARARTSHHKHHTLHVAPAPPSPPSQDAVELATLAPPALRSTVEQTYGDAAYARDHAQRRIERDVRADRADVRTFGGAPYPCEPHTAGPDAYACNGAPHPRGYGQGYGFTPDYLSAPQRLGVSPDRETQVLPPLTGLAWVIDSLRYDAHN